MRSTSTTVGPAERLIATALFVVAIPVIILGALVSFAHYRAWPFFVHRRVGVLGTPFRLVKIRTLPTTTNPYVDKYTIETAPIPRMMRLVRRLHFDEIPQLIHVALGRMAFVGPRPEMPELHRGLPERFASHRTSVLPGLTCLWQISPHCTGLIGERTEYDRLYVDNRNAKLDLWILWRTAMKMLTGRTSHLHEVPQWAMTVPRSAARHAEPAQGVGHGTEVLSTPLGVVD